MAAPPLQCQAVLHQAAHRGIDLQRWFGPAVIPAGDFEKKMMGLGLGVAAGLPAEAAQCVERGLARGALDEAVAAAAAGDGAEAVPAFRLRNPETVYEGNGRPN